MNLIMDNRATSTDQLVRTADARLHSLLWVAQNALGDRVFEAALGTVARRLRARVDALPSPTQHREIERVEGYDHESFVTNYYRKGRPVIFTGLARDWACVRNWTPDFFAKVYGDYQLEVGDDKYTDVGGNVDMIAMRDAVELLKTSSIRYVRFSPFFVHNPELLEDVDARFQSQLRRLMLAKGGTQLFMGGEGTTTELHAAMTNNMFVQISGEKQWWLVHPSSSARAKPICERSPTFRSHLKLSELDRLDCHTGLLKAGDVLYLPPFYWHAVRNPTFSIGMAYRWLALRPSFKTSPTMCLLTATATSPSPFLFFLDVKQGNSAPHFFRKARG